MIWWFLILGISTLVVVCVVIALVIHLRKHLQKAHAQHEATLSDAESQRRADTLDSR